MNGPDATLDWSLIRDLGVSAIYLARTVIFVGPNGEETVRPNRGEYVHLPVWHSRGREVIVHNGLLYYRMDYRGDGVQRFAYDPDLGLELYLTLGL